MIEPELAGVSSPVAVRPSALVCLKGKRKRCEIIARHSFGGAVTVRLAEGDEFFVHESEVDMRDHAAYMRDKASERLREIVSVFTNEMSGLDTSRLNAGSFPKFKLDRVAKVLRLKPRTVMTKLCQARQLGMI